MIPPIDVWFVDKPDYNVNSIGAKGLGFNLSLALNQLNIGLALDFFYSDSNPMGAGQVRSSALVMKGDIVNGDFEKLISFLNQ